MQQQNLRSSTWTNAAGAVHALQLRLWLDLFTAQQCSQALHMYAVRALVNKSSPSIAYVCCEGTDQ